MRSLWWAYSPLLDKADAAKWRDQFKLLADIAGKTRNWDILRELLTAFESSRGLDAQLQMLVNDRRDAAAMLSREEILQADVGPLLQRAIDSARHQLAALAKTPAAADFAKSRILAARRALKEGIKRARACRKPDCAALHRVRIAGKRLRYLLEFFSPIFNQGPRKTIAWLTAAQDELGQLNDIVASEALLRDSTLWHDMVRPGIALYGGSVRHLLPGLTPAQTLLSYPVRIAHIPAGETIGYGRTFKTERDSLIMTLPIGYGDGYPRLLGNRAHALVRGHRAALQFGQLHTRLDIMRKPALEGGNAAS